MVASTVSGTVCTKALTSQLMSGVEGSDATADGWLMGPGAQNTLYCALPLAALWQR